MNKQRQRPPRKSHALRTLSFALLLALLVLTLASCKKEAAKPAGHKNSGEKTSQSLQNEVLADAKKAIAIIESSKNDPVALEPAVAGKALDTLKTQMAEMKSTGLIKVREYDNLKVTFGTYQKKVAGVTAEFVDNSRIIRIDNGQPQAVARAEKKKLYLGLTKLEGKWKIISILAGANETAGQ